MFHYFASCFGWLPPGLSLLVGAVFFLFSIVILIAVVKILIKILTILKDIVGGLFAKVVSFFV